jgi:hypothetical protein
MSPPFSLTHALLQAVPSIYRILPANVVALGPQHSIACEGSGCARQVKRCIVAKNVAPPADEVIE